MMRAPTEFDLSQLIHGYDMAGAHQHYLRSRNKQKPVGSVVGTRHHGGIRDEQKKELAHSIQSLDNRLQKLETLIHTRELEEAKVNRKTKAKKERAAKERDKPNTAAEKARTVRDLQRKPELTHEQKRKKSISKKYSVSELKSLAIKVRGQLAVAKQKLAAL